MKWSGVVLLIANAVIGLGAGLLVAAAMYRLSGTWSFGRCLAVTLGVYLLECMAIAAGMLIPVFSLALAVVWGIIFGRWLKGLKNVGGKMRFAAELSSYTCLPWVTLLTIPCIYALTGRSILDTYESVMFGVPDFVPWPADTILGFFLCLVVVVSALKIGITLGILWLYERPVGAPPEGEDAT